MRIQILTEHLFAGRSDIEWKWYFKDHLAAHGIVSKDDLVLTGGVYQIQSEKQGLSEKKVCVLQMEHLRLLPVQMRSTVRIQMKIQKDLFI